jgi:hypothetical protein
LGSDAAAVSGRLSHAGPIETEQSVQRIMHARCC